MVFGGGLGERAGEEGRAHGGKPGRACAGTFAGGERRRARGGRAIHGVARASERKEIAAGSGSPSARRDGECAGSGVERAGSVGQARGVKAGARPRAWEGGTARRSRRR